MDSEERKMEDSIVGEKAFAKLCNSWNCEHLHIGQTVDEMSSAMFSSEEKRPDYLVNVPDLAPVFFEVKTYTPVRFEKDEWGLRHMVFRENHEKFIQMKNFESGFGTRTWYAFIERSKDHVEESFAYLVPLSRMEKWIPKAMQGDPVVWTHLVVPIRCMNKCSKGTLDMNDKCMGCTDQLCENVQT